ncbi:MAG TPA: hypothetical protein VEI49_09650 [Terriglobales bacterium]|nr:hypothetical protein [Terriglobales bacterium]
MKERPIMVVSSPIVLAVLTAIGLFAYRSAVNKVEKQVQRHAITSC